jgi:3-polyprenyl-4-hydroxybenzoate decarboxylase
MVDNLVGRLLQRVGISNDLYHRWDSKLGS